VQNTTSDNQHCLFTLSYSGRVHTSSKVHTVLLCNWRCKILPVAENVTVLPRCTIFHRPWRRSWFPASLTWHRAPWQYGTVLTSFVSHNCHTAIAKKHAFHWFKQQPKTCPDNIRTVTTKNCQEIVMLHKTTK